MLSKHAAISKVSFSLFGLKSDHHNITFIIFFTCEMWTKREMIRVKKVIYWWKTGTLCPIFCHTLWRHMSRANLRFARSRICQYCAHNGIMLTHASILGNKRGCGNERKEQTPTLLAPPFTGCNFKWLISEQRVLFFSFSVIWKYYDMHMMMLLVCKRSFIIYFFCILW